LFIVLLFLILTSILVPIKFPINNLISWYHFHLHKIFRDTCEYMHNSPTTRSKVERRECGSARAVIMHSSGYYTHPFRSRGGQGVRKRLRGDNSRGWVRTTANAFGTLRIVSALSRLKILHLRRIKTLIPGERDGGTSRRHSIVQCEQCAAPLTPCAHSDSVRCDSLTSTRPSWLTRLNSLHWLSRSPENDSFIPNQLYFRDTILPF